MTAPDQALIDLLAAHSVFSFTERGGRVCNCGWTGLEHPAHVALVMGQHAGRTEVATADARRWEARADKAEATVARVEALVERAERHGSEIWAGNLIAALEGEQR